MAERFISPFVLDEVGGSHVPEDVSFYGEVDSSAKHKVSAPIQAFLDDSLEEDQKDVSLAVGAACLASCIASGGGETQTLVELVEAKGTLPDTFLDDSLESDEHDLNSKANMNEPATHVSEPHNCPNSSMQPLEVASLSSKPLPLATSAGDGKGEEVSAVQPCAKVMPMFGKKKAATTVSTKGEPPAKGKKLFSGTVKGGRKIDGAAVLESGEEVNGCKVQSASLPRGQSTNEVKTGDQVTEGGGGGNSNNNNGHSSAEDMEDSKENLSTEKKKKKSVKVEGKQVVKQKSDKETSKESKERQKAEKKLEQERKKVELEKVRAKREQEKIEKELRMIEREFNRLEREERLAKKNVDSNKPSPVEDKANLNNEFQIFNLEEEGENLQEYKDSGAHKVGVVCVGGGDQPPPTSVGSPKAEALPEDEEAHHISAMVPAGEGSKNGQTGGTGEEGMALCKEKFCVFGKQTSTSENLSCDGVAKTFKLSTFTKLCKKSSTHKQCEGTECAPITRILKVVPTDEMKQSGVCTESQLQSEDKPPPCTVSQANPALCEEGASETLNSGTTDKNKTSPGTSEKTNSSKPLTGSKPAKTISKPTTGSISLKKKKNATTSELCKKKEPMKQSEKFTAKPGKRKSEDSAEPTRKKKSRTHSGPVWVQCDDCKKWRVLKDCHDPSEVPNKWVCSMNKDEDFNSCAFQEEEADDLGDSEEFVYSTFVAGSVVWAKMCGYPWWPAMIDEDPDEELYYESSVDGAQPTKYHVVFLGKPVSRAWLQSDGICPFTGSCDMNEGVKKYKQGLQEAFQEALVALEMAIDDRLATFSFSSRFFSNKSRKRKQMSTRNLKEAISHSDEQEATD